MPNKKTSSLSYLITVSRAHFMPAQMLILTLRQKTKNPIVVVGNLSKDEAELVEALGVKYIDEDSIDLSGRLPNVKWEEKFRPFGWYKQMFIRLSIDRFMETDQVVILDSEVFIFDNWDEKNFYDPKTGNPRSFYWTPTERKPDWDYQMYRGAAYLLSFLSECKGIMEYANSDKYKRHISGVVLFSTKNVAKLWEKLATSTDLRKNIEQLFNHEKDLAFSDHDFYGLAVEYGLFDKTVPTITHPNLLGWYDNHDDKVFGEFKRNAMWSMCQRYFEYTDPHDYRKYMHKVAIQLGKKLPRIKYWNQPDRELIDDFLDNAKRVKYFEKYTRQLDLTFRKRFNTMYGALKALHKNYPNSPMIVEIGTLRDNNTGGGHSTYKFGEYLSRFGGKLYTVDIAKEAITFSKKASSEFQPWITYCQDDSEHFLKNFKGQIHMLYLDGFDSTPGMEKAASQKQLREIKAAMPKLAESSIVLLDDADLPEGGKAALSSHYLVNNGFRMTLSQYQQLFIRWESSKGLRTKIKRFLIDARKS